MILRFCRFCCRFSAVATLLACSGGDGAPLRPPTPEPTPVPETLAPYDPCFPKRVDESEADNLDCSDEVVSGSMVPADPPAKHLGYARRSSGHLFQVETPVRWRACATQQAGFACYKFEAEDGYAVGDPTPPWRSTPGEFAPYRIFRGADGSVCMDRFRNASSSPFSERPTAFRQIHRAFDRLPTEVFACAAQLVGFGDGSTRQFLSRDSGGHFHLDPRPLPPGDVVTTSPWDDSSSGSSAFVAVWDGKRYTAINAGTGEQRTADVSDLRFVTPEAGGFRTATLSEAGALVSGVAEVRFPGTLVATLTAGLLVADPAAPTTLKLFKYVSSTPPIEIPVTLPYRGVIVGCLSGIIEERRLIEFGDGARREVMVTPAYAGEPLRRAFAPALGRVITMSEEGFVVLEQADGLYAYRAL